MCSDKYYEKLFSCKSALNHVCTSQQPKPSAEKKTKKLTLFEDLLETSNHGADVIEDQYGGDYCPSDCESGVSGGESEQRKQVSDNGLVGIGGGELIHGIIEQKLVSSFGSRGFAAKIEGINRVDYNGLMSRAKLESFLVYTKAVEMKCNGDANVKYAWFGGSRREINSILSHGFCVPTSNGSYGNGVVSLSPVEHPVESLPLAAADEDGLMHMLFCRVIMGKMETILPSSEKYNPSSEEFDSGVDDLASPRKYIVWSSRMNTHILPEYVVSFRATSYQREKQRNSINLQTMRVPNSAWMPFPTLIAALSKFLPSDAIELISKHHSDYRKQKLTRPEMIRKVRNIAGDNLLMAIIKSYRGKMRNVSRADKK